jgi:gamma-glutamylcyclotransferase (GGCT)/AIG2-like uncharacterized protein YtfP
MYYFAYGLSLNKKQMTQCCPNSQPRFSAELPNYKLIFSGWSRQWGGAIAGIKVSSGDKVLGGVYEINENELPKLDRFENYPNTCEKLKVLVFRDIGKPVEAVTYIKKHQTDEGKPSTEYLAVIQQGYRDWGLI